jgi:putative ABC transport system permease protein
MLYILKHAIRNIGRNRRRSILAAVSVALSLMFIVFLHGMINGEMSSMVKNYTKSETGHVRIAHRKFEEKYRFFPVNNYLEHPDDLLKTVRENKKIEHDITTIAERIVFGTLLSNDGNNKTVLAFSGDPEKEKNLLMLNASINEGRYITSRREAIIGSRVAQSLRYVVGDTIRVMTQASDHSLQLKKFVLVGIFKSGVMTLDDAVMQIHIDDARELLRMGTGTQQIVVMLRDYRKSDKVAETIRASIGDTSIAVTPWTRIGDYYRMVAMMSKMYVWLYLIVGALGAFIISNIMMMVVMERRREIGILKSMGVSRREIMLLFLTEGMMLGLIGSICGTIIGASVVGFFHVKGIDLSFALESMNFPMDTVIRPTLSVGNAMAALTIGTVLAGIMSFLPSRQASRMNAVESIKSV